MQDFPKMTINEEEIKPRAYLHRKADRFVTIDPGMIDDPLVLVAWEDIVDHVDWLERGVAEWREEALRLKRELERLQNGNR